MPARLAEPALTTIAQPMDALVRAAAEQLLAIIRAGAPPVRVIVPVQLVERASVRALR